jgi:tetratricopeptide (TPR) repeat protein
MDRGVSVGRAAERRLWEVVRAVGQDNFDLGERLVSHLRDHAVLRLDPGAFLEFDNRLAGACLREFLGARAVEFVLSGDSVPGDALADLRLWEQVDLPMPLGQTWRQRPAWLEHLLLRGLVHDGPRGMTLSTRLRLHLWLSDEDTPPTEPLPSSPVWQALRTLRRQGRWHEAALWAWAVSQSRRGLLERHPSLTVTIALGLTQSQHFESLGRWFEELESQGRAGHLFKHSGWEASLGAVRAFAAIERGRPLPPGPPREARFWHALVKCWWHLYAGNYRRVLRMLDFLQAHRSARIEWIDPVLMAWRAAVFHYLERYREARECNLRALELVSRLGWRERKLVMLRNLAVALFENGEVDQSLAILQGLERRHTAEHRLSALPGVFNARALIMNTRVRLGTGAWTNRRAQHLGLQAGSMHQYLYFREGQAVRARRCGENEIAERLFLEVEELATRIGHPLARGHAVWNRARLVWCRGDVEGGLELLRRAEEWFGAMHQFTRQADMKCDRALCLLEQGEFDGAAAEIDAAEATYAAHGWPREAALLAPMRLELSLRRDSGAVEESQLDGIRSAPEDTRTRSAYTYAVVALGFALMEDDLTCTRYGRETLAEVNRLQDPFMVRHILDLGRELRKHSRTVEDLVSYWSGTFPFRESGA